MSKRRIFGFWQALAGLAAVSLCACGGTPTVTVESILPPANLLILSTASTGELPEAIVNSPYSYGFETNLGESGVSAIAPITFLPSTGIPPGMTLSAEGVLSGTPTEVGTYPVRLLAVDSTSPTPQDAAAVYLLNVRLPGATLTQVAHNNLGGHGQNADVAVAPSASGTSYAYIGTRGSPGNCPATGVKVVDLSQITSPQLVATAGGVPGASQQEARVLTGLSTPAFHSGSQGDLMAVTEQPCDPSAAAAVQEGIEFFDVSDPVHPALLGSWSSGVAGVSDVALVPAAGKIYALAAVPNSETSAAGNGEGDLRVLDVSDPSQPREIGNWGILAATSSQLPQVVMGQDQRVFLDSIQLSSDRKTAYLGYWDEGVVVLDVSDPTAIRTNNPSVFLNHIIYPTTTVATTTTPSSPEGNTHLALPVVNDTELLVADEVCASAMGPNPANPAQTVALNPSLAVVCGPKNSVPLDLNDGWGYLRTYALPSRNTATLQGFFTTPEAESSPAPDNGIYTAHNIAWNGDPIHPHAYVAWFSSGVVDLDLTSIAPPGYLAAFVPPDTPDPNGTNPAVNNPTKALVYGVAAYNVNGQPYILASDINSGLWILQETPASTLTFLTISLPDGNVGVPYFATLSTANAALGSDKVSYAMSANSLPLPSGLALDSTTGDISGTPLVAGTVAVQFQAEDSDGNSTLQTINMTITQNMAVLPVTPPLGTVLEPYSYTLGALDGILPFTWSVVRSSLPTGLTLSSGGVISGTPVNVGTSVTTVQVTDSSTPPLTATLPITLQVSPLTAATPILPNATVGETYAYTMPMANGVGPFVPAVVDGSVPPGLAVTQGEAPLSGWLISGTATTAGVYNFSVQITDSYNQTLVQPFVLVVEPFEISPVVLFSGEEGHGYVVSLSANGGQGPYIYNLTTGTLPAGVTLSSSGLLTGVPASGTAGTYPLVIQAVDTNGLVTSKAYSLVIFSGNSFAITTVSLPPAQAGQSYTQAIAADFGTVPYTFAVSSGNLPSGVTLSANGNLSGVPGASSTGTYSFSLTATDASGHKAVRSYVWTVLPAISPN